MKILICNDFALSMLDREAQKIDCRVPRPCGDPVRFLQNADHLGIPVHSVVGHAETAAVFAAVLGRPVAYNRETVKIAKDERLLVGQYVGERLTEGATALPKGAIIEWWII